MRMNGSWVLLGVLLATLACGSDEKPAAKAPAEPPKAAEPAKPVPEPAKPAPEPAPAEPAAGGPGPGDVAAGHEQYKIYCATCHGETGCGDGPLSETLDPKPAKHCDGNYMNALSDEHLFKVIKEGGAAVGKSAQMAPWGGTLSDAQIWDVIAFIRSIAEPPYQKTGG